MTAKHTLHTSPLDGEKIIYQVISFLYTHSIYNQFEIECNDCGDKLFRNLAF